MAHVVRWFAKFKHGETVIVSWNFASKGTSILERPFFWAVIFHGEIHGFCTWIESSLATKSQARLHAGCCWLLVEYPLGMTNIAIENGHRNSGFSHEKWWFSIVMLNYQRVFDQPSQLNIGCFLVKWHWLSLDPRCDNSDLCLPLAEKELVCPCKAEHLKLPEIFGLCTNKPRFGVPNFDEVALLKLGVWPLRLAIDRWFALRSGSDHVDVFFCS